MEHPAAPLSTWDAASPGQTRGSQHRLLQQADWLIPTALIALVFIPVAAGMFRLTTLAGGAPVTPDNVRFFASPIPVVLHIVSVTV
ncbi:MAG TPA: hypothetical protein VGO70_03455 [Arsenicitalea sp.]|nr:hypothetical protein [Arsenicitalea sp.]